MSTSSKHSSHPFVPSPRWLSESPGQPLSSHDPRQSEELWSPAPPPPANLYPSPSDTFNVDPGVPFLATAGSAGGSDTEHESESGSSGRKAFAGGFVTGIRDTVRRSIRRRRRNTLKEPAYFLEQEEFRDSGYGSSNATAPVPSPVRHPSSTEAQTSHEQPIQKPAAVQYYAPYQKPNDPNFAAPDHFRNYFDPTDLQRRVSLFSGTVTAETASIKYGSDYAKMEVPLDTKDSLGAYIKRTRNFINQIASLPFSSRTRVTYDYYPERDLRDDPRRRPYVEWNRPNYGPTDYSPAEDSKPAVQSPIPSQQNPIMTSHRVPAVSIDLREEFSDLAHPSTFQNAKSTQPEVHPAPIANVQYPTFQVTSALQGLQPQTINTDRSWDEAISTTRHSAGKRRTTTPFHLAALIDAETTQGGWQQYPHYRDGYVPAELAEGHYGSRYGTGIHTTRAGSNSFVSIPSSAISRKYPQA